jgi:sulfite exporter TauE/SafE
MSPNPLQYAVLCLAGHHALSIGGGLFLAGLVGGFAHCAGMCGPFVLAQLPRPDGGEWRLSRLATGLLPGYQLGRLTVYTALGAIAGGFGGAILGLATVHWLAAVLLGGAALLFFGKALGSSIATRLLPSMALAGPAGAIAAAAAPLLRASSHRGWRSLLLGMVLGFLPCGMLYAALAAAAATGGPVSGALAMAGFAFGTMPALAIVGALGTVSAARWRHAAAIAVRPIYLFNGATLALLAWHSLG